MTTTTLRSRAAVTTSPDEPMTVRHLDVAPPGTGEVRVRIHATGVCHSDLHARTGEWTNPMPLVLGHEGAGVVESVGAGVDHLAVGDHVVLSWIAPCGRCARCARGQGWACATGNDLEFRPESARLYADGVPVAPYLGLGTWSEYVVVSGNAAVRIDPQVPFDVAALIGCAVTTGVGAVRNNARVSPGRSVLVVGCGGVGLSILMGARLSGATPIVAVDLDDEKLELARQFGATHVALPTDTDQAWRELCPDGVDYAFDAVGSPVTAKAAIEALAPAGTAVLVGMPAEGTQLTIDPLDLAVSGQTLIGSNFGGTVPLVDFPELCRLFLAGSLPVDRMISRRVDLDDAESTLEAMRGHEGTGRTVIVFDQN